MSLISKFSYRQLLNRFKIGLASKYIWLKLIGLIAYLTQIRLIKDTQRLAVSPRVEPICIATVTIVGKPETSTIWLWIKPGGAFLWSDTPCWRQTASRVAWVRAETVHITHWPTWSAQMYTIGTDEGVTLRIQLCFRGIDLGVDDALARQWGRRRHFRWDGVIGAIAVWSSG